VCVLMCNKCYAALAVSKTQIWYISRMSFAPSRFIISTLILSVLACVFFLLLAGHAKAEPHIWSLPGGVKVLEPTAAILDNSSPRLSLIVAERVEKWSSRVGIVRIGFDGKREVIVADSDEPRPESEWPYEVGVGPIIDKDLRSVYSMAELPDGDLLYITWDGNNIYTLRLASFKDRSVKTILSCNPAAPQAGSDAEASFCPLSVAVNDSGEVMVGGKDGQERKGQATFIKYGLWRLRFQDGGSARFTKIAGGGVNQLSTKTQSALSLDLSIDRNFAGLTAIKATSDDGFLVQYEGEISGHGKVGILKLSLDENGYSLRRIPSVPVERRHSIRFSDFIDNGDGDVLVGVDTGYGSVQLLSRTGQKLRVLRVDT
jgi:hypothetical protein